MSATFEAQVETDEGRRILLRRRAGITTWSVLNTDSFPSTAPLRLTPEDCVMLMHALAFTAPTEYQSALATVQEWREERVKARQDKEKVE